MFKVINHTGTNEDKWRESMMDAVNSCDGTHVGKLIKAIGSISKPHLDYTAVSNRGPLFTVRCPAYYSTTRCATPLCLAAIKGNKGIAQQLLCAGASVDFTGEFDDYTPLMLSAMYGHKDICILLLRHGADINLQTDCELLRPNTALYFVALNGESAIVSLLLDHQADLCDFQLWNDSDQVVQCLPSDGDRSLTPICLV